MLSIHHINTICCANLFERLVNQQSHKSRGNRYRIVGIWEPADFLFFPVGGRKISAAENVLVAPIGERSSEMVSSRGHYYMQKVIPVNKAAVNLFGGPNSRYVPEYLLQTAN